MSFQDEFLIAFFYKILGKILFFAQHLLRIILRKIRVETCFDFFQMCCLRLETTNAPELVMRFTIWGSSSKCFQFIISIFFNWPATDRSIKSCIFKHWKYKIYRRLTRCARVFRVESNLWKTSNRIWSRNSIRVKKRVNEF